MNKKLKNYAFIDGNNLYLGAKAQDISLDYGALRKYLREKLDVEVAFLFIGFNQSNTALYSTLQGYGYRLVFKPTIPYIDEFTGKKTMKGNVDAEIVLHAAAIEISNYRKAIIVSSDGDFSCLIRYLEENNKLEKIITPTEHFSKLLTPFSDYVLPLKVIKSNISTKNNKKTRKNH